MAPARSSKGNESLNDIINSKAPKKRHYGGSESSGFRKAAGLAQFNEGYNYVLVAAENMGLEQMPTTAKYARTKLNKISRKARGCDIQ